VLHLAKPGGSVIAAAQPALSDLCSVTCAAAVLQASVFQPTCRVPLSGAASHHCSYVLHCCTAAGERVFTRMPRSATLFDVAPADAGPTNYS
jgi:hypothetical protein